MNSCANDLVGKMFDRYLLEQRIKHSRMSTVYRARQLHLARPVAVKVINGHLGEDNEFLLRFRREARIMARLEHTNIIPIYDYGEQEGFAYIVMPYFPRGSLHDMLASRGRCSQHEILAYLQQAAAALDYAHAHGIVHLDLKPSNFLLHSDGRLVLTDFGIARIMRYNDQAFGSVCINKGQLLGTPEYMPPEVIQGEWIDYRADIYELGIVLYQLLSGNLPFRGDSTPAILFKQLHESPALLHQIDETIPPEVDAVVRRAIAKRREERYASARTLAHALQAVSTPSTYPVTINQLFSTALPKVTNLSRMLAAATIEGYIASVPLSPAKAAIFESEESNSARPKSNRNAFRFFVFALLTIALVICGCLILLISSQAPQEPTPVATASTLVTTPMPTSTLSQEAIHVVRQYYDLWNNRDYPGAYSQLESSYQKMHPYNTLIGSYENIQHSSITIESITQLPNEAFKVVLTDVATEKSSLGEQAVRKIYHGYYILKKENSKWRLIPYFK